MNHGKLENINNESVCMSSVFILMFSSDTIRNEMLFILRHWQKTEKLATNSTNSTLWPVTSVTVTVVTVVVCTLSLVLGFCGLAGIHFACTCLFVLSQVFSVCVLSIMEELPKLQVCNYHILPTYFIVKNCFYILLLFSSQVY